MTDPAGPPEPPAPQGPAGGPVCYRHPDRETWIRCQRCERPICPDCMREASVGFQCPDCVREGRRTTRHAQGSYGGTPSVDPRLTTFVLMGLNVLVFVAILATGGAASRIYAELRLLPVGGNYAHLGHLDGVSSGAWWQLLTSGFVHVEPLHIGTNMLALYFLGPPVESLLGRARFLAVYFVSLLAGSTAALWLGAENAPVVGASGAIFGLMGALLVVMLLRGYVVQQLLFWIGLNAVFSFTVANVSWQGHLGGFVGGALLALALVKAPRARRTTWQWAAVVALAVVLLVAVAVRVSQLPS